MTNNHITISNFDFRTKFRKILTESNQDSIQKAFETFCTLTKMEAIDQLWELTYNPFIILADFNLTEVISSENTELFRNELRHQYEKLFPHFLYCEGEIICKQAMNSFNDRIVAYILYWRCFYSACYLADDETAKNRILYLLKSEDEKLYFGGIRSLSFNKEEAKFLKKFHKEIYFLCKTLYENVPERDQNKDEDSAENSHIEVPTTEPKEPEEKPAFPATNDTAAKTNPDESSVDEPQDNCDEFLIADIQESEDLQAEPEPKELTPENVLKDIMPFIVYAIGNNANALRILGNYGYDLNQVIAKKDEIKTFIEASNKLR